MNLRETLADQSHEIWSHWMQYLLSQCLPANGGCYEIPAHLVERWERQIQTEYKDLTEREKDSDREQADKLLQAMLNGVIDRVVRLSPSKEN
jgi:hypothetical protein